MKQEDIRFCQQHIINFEAVKHGFTRNIPFDVLGRYEQMYRAYLDPQFSLTYWCGECVFDMLKRLINYYELHLVAQQNVQKEEHIAQPEMQNTMQEKKKRGRPKK